jgi:hypothetical protein
MSPPPNTAASRPLRRRKLSPSAALGAILVALAGCGDGAREHPDSASGATVSIQRATFTARQHVGQRSTIALTVRNAGGDAIPNLVVALRGLRDRAAGRNVWLIDVPPAGATAIADTWTAGALAPGASATLRWAVTPVVAGTRDLRYEIATSPSARAPATLRDGGSARGILTVRVSDRPAQARVDPRTGDVQRQD